MKPAGEQGEIIAAVDKAVGGRPERGTTTTTVSNSTGSSSSSSSDCDDDEDNSEESAINDNRHRQKVHVVDVEKNQGTWNSEPSPPRRSVSSNKVTINPVTISNSGKIATASATGSSVVAISIKSPQVPKQENPNCESCSTRPLGLHKSQNPTYSQQRSKSLPHGKKTGASASLGDSSEITTIRELTSEQSNSVSGVLRFCKRRVLFPYLKLLGAMGLKPLYSDGNNNCVRALSKFYLILVGAVLLIGYGLQFMTCFRRDHGFSYKPDFLNPPTSLHDYDREIIDRNLNLTRGHVELLQSRRQGDVGEEDKWFLENTICTGNAIYVYIVPPLLHMTSFVYMVYLYWIYDDEHLQNLMERVFIQAAHANINFFSQRRLIRRLQGLVCIGTIWIIILTTCQILHVFLTKIYFNIWTELDYNMTYSMSTILLFATLWQDAIQVTIVISFAIQCNLICTYTELIKGRLMQHSISLVECMKELGELGQLLSYLNDDLALGLAPLLVIDGIYASGSIVHLVKNGKNLSLPFLILLVVSATTWVFIIVFPLTQAARVSTCCQKLKDMGHMIRIRPFGYQFVSQFDLDSFLLFASNLNLKARILKIPITSPILSGVAIVLSIAVILWGYFQ